MSLKSSEWTIFSLISFLLKFCVDFPLGRSEISMDKTHFDYKKEGWVLAITLLG